VQNAATFRAACGSYTTPAIWCDATAEVPAERGARIASFAMPNPFRDRLAVAFTAPRAGRVRVDLFGADGRLVQRLADGQFTAGSHVVPWNARHRLPSGVYFYRVEVNGEAAQGRVVRVQ
jgi:hypothetical protein